MFNSKTYRRTGYECIVKRLWMTLYTVLYTLTPICVGLLARVAVLSQYRSILLYDFYFISVLHCIHALLVTKSQTYKVTKTTNTTQSVVYHRYISKVKVMQGILPCLSHFIRWHFTHVGLLLRFAECRKPKKKLDTGETSVFKVW